MWNELINTLSHLNTSGLHWFILLADGTVKGTAILAIIIVLVKFWNRMRPQISYLILFLTILSLLAIPLLTRGIAVINDNHFGVKRVISHSQISDQPLNQILKPVIQITPQIPGEAGLAYQLPHWSVWLFLIWSIGVMITLGKLFMEIVSTYRLNRNTDRIINNEWLAMLHELKAELKLHLPVTLKFQNSVPVPVVLGCFKPVILIPESAVDWSAERCRVVLLHELSHIKRYDNLRQSIAALVAIVYWFNPLVWISLRLLRTNRELACDEQVLETGILPSTYAAHLLAIIRNSRSAHSKLKTVSAMASTNIEQRMVNILTKNDRRKPLAKHKFLGLIIIALLTVVLCSSTSLIGLVTANDQDSGFIENPQISMQGDQLELIIHDTALKGSVLELPTLWPEKGVKNMVVAPFGVRFHPILKENRQHIGIDIRSPQGTPIVATADGEVIMAEFSGGYGNYIAIKHKYLISTYSHLSKILIHSGDSVHRGDIIAYSGDSGIATGPHLHYEIRYGETFINPQVLAGLADY
jgi:murein DD-endopeptidase MepM/ murein hydrolase activator NlpD